MRLWREFYGTLNAGTSVTLSAETIPEAWYITINNPYTGAIYASNGPNPAIAIPIFQGDSITLPGISDSVTLVSRVNNGEDVNYVAIAYRDVTFSFGRVAIPGGTLVDKIVCQLYTSGFSTGSSPSFLPWHTKLYDNYNLFNPATPTLVTLNEPGTWIIQGAFNITNSPTSGSCSIAIYINGSLLYGTPVLTFPVSQPNKSLTITGIYTNTSTTDYVQIQFWQSSANMATLNSYLNIVRLSKL